MCDLAMGMHERVILPQPHAEGDSKRTYSFYCAFTVRCDDLAAAAAGLQ